MPCRGMHAMPCYAVPRDAVPCGACGAMPCRAVLAHNATQHRANWNNGIKPNMVWNRA